MANDNDGEPRTGFMIIDSTDDVEGRSSIFEYFSQRISRAIFYSSLTTVFDTLAENCSSSGSVSSNA